MINVLDRQLIDINDLAKLLNISKTTAYRFIGNRKIPFYKIGHSVRFSLNDVEKYLEKIRVEQISNK